MKIRIQGQSLRLRIARSEIMRFATSGHLEETIHFGPAKGAELTCELVSNLSGRATQVESAPGWLRILLPSEIVRGWVSTDQVGIEAEVDVGPHGTLSILIEKDFACLDRSAEENADTFPNPLAASVC